MLQDDTLMALIGCVEFYAPSKITVAPAEA